MRWVWILIVLIANLLGCSNTSPVAVREGSLTAIVPSITSESKVTGPRAYVVQPGDTIYSIAWNFNLDYRDLAATNNIPAPYHLHSGQILQLMNENTTAGTLVATETTGVQVYAVEEPTVIASSTENNLSPVTSTAEATPAQTTATVPAPAKAAAPVASTNPQKWVWPAKGKVSRGFSKQNKGIDIAGARGEPIYATAAGNVVYSGTGLRGYGQLIIVKHSEEFLSAYAHNSVVLVAEGDAVKQGQKMAEMGDTGTNQVKLHFELRLRGKPVDPQKYLPRR